MAAGVLQLVATLPSVTGLPADAVQNVIHTTYDDTAPLSDATDLCTAFADFYRDQATGASAALGVWISDSISRVALSATIRAYFTSDLSGATPFGSPIAALGFTIPNNAASGQLPEEVAMVISYHGDLTDVPVTIPNPTPPPNFLRPAQRRRARLYFGPLIATAVFDVASQPARPSTVLMDDLGDAMVQLGTDIAAAGHNLCVWSKADAALYVVDAGWVDNAFDIQRRRGPKPSNRDGFTFA